MNRNWQDLILLIRHRFDLAQNWLLRGEGPFADRPEEVSEAYHLASIHGLSSLLLRYLLAQLLIQRDLRKRWVIPWLRRHMDIPQILGGLSLSCAIKGRWMNVDVPTVNQATNTPQWVNFTIGCVAPPQNEISPLPEWCETMLSQESQETILVACKLAKKIAHSRKIILVYPMCAEGNPPLTGNSMGLPLALAALFLIRGLQWPKGLVATGGLDQEGKILPAGYVFEKMSLAEKKGVRFFLFPSRHGGNPIATTCSAIPVSTLEEAWFYARLFTSEIENPSEYFFYRQCLKEPKRFFNNFRNLPIEFLIWAEREKTLPELTALQNLDVFKELVSAMVGVYRDPLRADILKKCLSIENVRGLAKISDGHKKLAFEWSSLTLAANNHQGNVEESKGWFKEAMKLASFAEPRELAHLFNRYFVGLRHNRYDFRPNLPKAFKDYFEKRDRIFKRTHEPDPILGGIYGTIAQNYGFCGPAYLKKVEWAVRKGIQAFGHLNKEDVRRLYCYLAFAKMDSQDYKGAQKTLNIYLDTDEKKGWSVILREDKDRFHQYAMSRYIADTGIETLSREYWGFWQNAVATCPMTHPWQLWCYNMGRIALRLHLIEKARWCWTRTLELCKTAEEKTIQPMTLLPLSALLSNGGLDASLEKITRDILIMIRDSKHFRQAHFKTLLQASGPIQTLEIIKKNPASFFPFMYR